MCCGFFRNVAKESDMESPLKSSYVFGGVPISMLLSGNLILSTISYVGKCLLKMILISIEQFSWERASSFIPLYGCN